MSTFIMFVHVAVSVFLVGAVLLQAGKGASIGATFGGSNQPLFGSSQGSFIGKLTAAAAIIFMLTSLSLAYMSTTSTSIMKSVEVQAPVNSEPFADGAIPAEDGSAGEGGM